MDSRRWFASAAAGLVELLPGLLPHLDEPGLGEWSVRSLLGHTNRAFITFETYAAAGAVDDEDETDDSTPASPTVTSPAAYFQAAQALLADPSGVAERGRQAGIALGSDPIEAVRETADRVVALAGEVADDTLVLTPVGMMTVSAYLPTRCFELTVHSLDLARATRQTPPQALVDTWEPTLALAGQIASADHQRALLLAATGREPLPGGFSIL